jgi:hypothetical protein
VCSAGPPTVAREHDTLKRNGYGVLESNGYGVRVCSAGPPTGVQTLYNFYGVRMVLEWC